jgi:hypothetical protein
MSKGLLSGRPRRFVRSPRSSKEGKNADWWARTGVILGPFLTVAGLYLANFYTPEDVVVSARTEQLGPAATAKGATITLVLTNLGKSSVPVDRVLLVYIFGPETSLDDRSKEAVVSEINSPNWRPKQAVKLAEGQEVVALTPSKVTFNNIDAATTGALVEAGKSALISYRFDPYSIEPFAAKRLLMTAAIHFFDKNGRPHWKLLTLSGYRTFVLPGFQDVFDSPVSGARLLPAKGEVFEKTNLPHWFYEEVDLSSLLNKPRP